MDVRNPSAWIISAVVKAKSQMGPMVMMNPMGGPMMMGGHMGGQMGRHMSMGGQMMGGPMMGHMGNMQMGYGMKGGNMMSRASPYGNQMGMGNRMNGGGYSGQNFGPAKSAVSYQFNPDALTQVYSMIDDKAQLLLQQLLEDRQLDIANKLLSQMQSTGVNNPSAWMAKACIAAGASPTVHANQDRSQMMMGQMPGGMQGQCGGMGMQQQNPMQMQMRMGMQQQQPATVMEIDERASALLHSLPHETQMEITKRLEESIAAQKVMNPSAWVAKACMKAQQQQQQSSQQPLGQGFAGQGVAGFAPQAQGGANAFF